MTTVRVDTLNGKMLDLNLTEKELKKESIHYPYNYVEREGKTVLYRVYPTNENEFYDENGEIEIDDLPDNITDIIINYIESVKLGDKNEKIRISNLYNEKTKEGCIFLSFVMVLDNVRGSWGKIEYNEDKVLIFDYRYWPTPDETFLTVEDKYETIYVEYNKKLEYLDKKINLERLFACFKKTIYEK